MLTNQKSKEGGEGDRAERREERWRRPPQPRRRAADRQLGEFRHRRRRHREERERRERSKEMRARVSGAGRLGGCFVHTRLKDGRRMQSNGRDRPGSHWATFGPGGMGVSRPRPKLRPGRGGRLRAARPWAVLVSWAENHRAKQEEKKSPALLGQRPSWTARGLGQMFGHGPFKHSNSFFIYIFYLIFRSI